MFSWNLALTGQASKITGKIKHDLVPTMVNGTFETGSYKFLGQGKSYISDICVCAQDGSSGYLRRLSTSGPCPCSTRCCICRHVACCGQHTCPMHQMHSRNDEPKVVSLLHCDKLHLCAAFKIKQYSDIASTESKEYEASPNSRIYCSAGKDRPMPRTSQCPKHSRCKHLLHVHAVGN